MTGGELVVACALCEWSACALNMNRHAPAAASVEGSISGQAAQPLMLRSYLRASPPFCTARSETASDPTLSSVASTHDAHDGTECGSASSHSDGPDNSSQWHSRLRLWRTHVATAADAWPDACSARTGSTSLLGKPDRHMLEQLLMSNCLAAGIHGAPWFSH